MRIAKRNRILIVNDSADCGRSYEPLFQVIGDVTHEPSHFKLNPFAFKLIVFTGGSDVSPEFYGDTSPKNICWSNKERDAEEKTIFKYGEQRGVRMTGICRGMQFLNVMTGGKMMHDISGHGGGNHQVMTKGDSAPFVTNSFHHQMCIPNTNTHILAWSNQKLSKRYIGDGDEEVEYSGPEVEAIYMPWLKAVGVQWHPECMPKGHKGHTWFVDLVNHLLSDTPKEIKNLYLGEKGAKITVGTHNG